MGKTNKLNDNNKLAVQMLIAMVLAINRPIEMLVTSLNCVGDSLTAIAVAKSEGKLDEEIYNK